MTSSTATTVTAAPRPAPARRGRAGWLVYLSVAIALALLSPLLLVGLDAGQAGWAEIHRVLFRARSQRLLVNTVELSIVVVTVAAVVGTAAAWCTERCVLPLRRLWTVLLVLPVAVPDFVAGYAWHSIRPSFTGLWAAALVMTLSTYPLVYLPVAAALRRADPGVEEVARSLGLGRCSDVSAGHGPADPAGVDRRLAGRRPDACCRSTAHSRSCTSRRSPPRSSPSSSSTRRRLLRCRCRWCCSGCWCSPANRGSAAVAESVALRRKPRGWRGAAGLDTRRCRLLAA